MRAKNGCSSPFTVNEMLALSGCLKNLNLYNLRTEMSKVKCLVLCFISIVWFQISCVSPTFESPVVRKYSQSWFGIGGGINSFDYTLPDETHYEPISMENTKGIFANCGFNYGFTENIGVTIGISLSLVHGLYDGINSKIEYYPSIYLASKFEITKNTSDNVLSVVFGPAYPELIKTRIMFGFKGVKNEMLTFGTNLFFYYPYDFFINLGPKEGSGSVIYLGYRIPYFGNPVNLALGLGYRFN